MRPIVLDGAIAAQLLLSARNSELGAQCEHWLRALAALDSGLALLIGITHSDLAPDFSLAPIRAALRRLGRPIPVFTLEARDRDQAIHLVRALLVR